jgi:hypothetical protein
MSALTNSEVLMCWLILRTQCPFSDRIRMTPDFTGHCRPRRLTWRNKTTRLLKEVMERHGLDCRGSVNFGHSQAAPISRAVQLCYRGNRATSWQEKLSLPANNFFHCNLFYARLDTKEEVAVRNVCIKKFWYKRRFIFRIINAHDKSRGTRFHTSRDSLTRLLSGGFSASAGYSASFSAFSKGPFGITRVASRAVFSLVSAAFIFHALDYGNDRASRRLSTATVTARHSWSPVGRAKWTLSTWTPTRHFCHRPEDCKIWHEYEDDCLLGSGVIRLHKWVPTFRMNLLPPSSGHNSSTVKAEATWSPRTLQKGRNLDADSYSTNPLTTLPHSHTNV